MSQPAMKFPILNRFTGEVQVEAQIEADQNTASSVKLGLAVKWAFGKKADLSEANLREADLSEADLRWANLREADLREADLRGANLRGANLSGANLSGANLHGAYLNGAYLNGADLHGADLSGANLIDGGQDSRGYRFVGYLFENALRIGAGCRDFTLDEARAHWAEVHAANPALQAECIAKVTLIEIVATARGWTETKQTEAA